MTQVTNISVLILVFLLWACDSSPQQNGVLKDSLKDNTSAPVTAPTDTTLQQKVEVVLRAIGSTPEEMKFDQDTLEVPADALVTLSLINEGTGLTIIHNFVLASEGMYKEIALKGEEVGATKNYVPESRHVFASTPLALPGQTVVQKFKSPPVGTYDFVCTYPDHWHKMHGKFIVR